MRSRSDFPDGFLFGVATSSYQIEGQDFGGAGRTIWDDFAETPGNVAGAETGAVACDHYHRWAEDLDLIRDGNFDIYRFSTSWARILPEGRGTPNPEGLDFYDRLVDGLLERGIKPAVTLYHWELPAALQDLGGWRNRDIASWFAEFTEVIMGRIGDRIWSAAPINEPWCVAWLSHFQGAHAPGHRDIRSAARAMHHVLLAHGQATQAMRAMGIGNLGAVCNFEYAAPADDSPGAQRAAETYDAIYNQFFLSGLFRGTYPDPVLDGLAAHLPKGWENDFACIGTPLDWIGINYYTRSLWADAPGAPWPALAPVTGPLAKTQIGWEIYPEGLHHFLHHVKSYAGDLPIYITENGIAEAPGADPLQDPLRQSYLADHLDQVHRAIGEGVDVRGYIQWSLMDNYEWSLGYAPRFGLVDVDRETLQRRPKSSYHALARALARA